MAKRAARPPTPPVGDVTATAEVSVVSNLIGVNFRVHPGEMAVRASSELTVPIRGPGGDPGGESFGWSSSDESVITLQANGDVATLTGCRRAIR